MAFLLILLCSTPLWSTLVLLYCHFFRSETSWLFRIFGNLMLYFTLQLIQPSFYCRNLFSPFYPVFYFQLGGLSSVYTYNPMKNQQGLLFVN